MSTSDKNDPANVDPAVLKEFPAPTPALLETIGALLKTACMPGHAALCFQWAEAYGKTWRRIR